MGTRSRIGIQLKDDSILSVYCHWDGYPSYNGRILRDNYNTVDKVRELIDGGNISALHTNAGWNNETLPKTGPLYYTMRGESIDSNEPELSKNQSEYLETADDCGEEYAIFSQVLGGLATILAPGMTTTRRKKKSLLVQLDKWHRGR